LATVEEAKEQVAGSLAAVGLIEHVRVTVPVKPFIGVTVIVVVFPEVAPGLTEMLPLFASVNVGSAVTVAVTTVVSVSEPAVPVTVMVYVPAVVLEVVVIVSTSVPVPPATVADARAQVAGLVAPAGLDTAQVRATADAKPFAGVTVIVEVLPVVAPAAMVILPLFVKANVGSAETTTFREVVSVNEPETPVTVTL
jgi:hypothetical protein